MKVWLRVAADVKPDEVSLEDEVGNDVAVDDLNVEYDGFFALIGPIELAEGEGE